MLVPITAKCNNRCISCIRLHSESEAVNVNLDFFRKKFSKIKDLEHICINGGEPTIHREFLQIVNFFNKKYPDSDILLLSNCRMFSNKKNVEKLRKLSAKNLRIGATIYGHNERIHEATTRSPGSFRQTTQGISTLILAGFNIELRVVVSKINYSYLEEIAKYICENLKGCKKVVFINMKIAGEAFKNRKLLIVKYTDILPYVEKAVSILETSGFDVSLFHFPLCLLPDSLWKNNGGLTIDVSEIEFTDTCKSCLKKKMCSGIWKHYIKEVGDSEFKAIK